jgi:tetratricopeptide (TPR) repeat protein
LSGGQAELAKGILQSYVAAHPDSPRPLYLLARVASQVEGKLPEARRLLEAALERRPDDFFAARILAQLAAVERAAGDAGAAQRAVDAALRRVPASAPVQYQAALLAFVRGDARALREAAGVLGERGGQAVAAEVRARSLELSATAEDAAAGWEASAAATPRDPTGFLIAAGAVARLGFAPRAVALCERAFERDLGEARLRRAVGDFWNGAPPLAESSRSLVALARGDRRAAAVALAGAGAAELLLGNAGRAEELGRRALSLAPQQPQAMVLAGYVALARGDARAAPGWALATLEAQPGQPAALALRARGLEAVGRRLEAQGAWREALDVAPDLTAGRLALARLLLLDGKPELARPLLESLVSDEPGAVEAVGALRDLRRPRAGSR